MFTFIRKKIFGWSMLLVFLCAVMLVIYFVHNIITTSDTISSLKIIEDTTTAEKIATAELLNACQWALYGSCAMLIATLVVTAVLELMLYNQIYPFVEKTLPICPKCGMTLEDETPYCPYCGNDMLSNENTDITHQAKLSTETTKQKTARKKKES